MSHPHAAHRQNKVEHSRVAHITKGYASGGAVSGDDAEFRTPVKGVVKKAAHKMHGGAVKQRADKPHRARGGRTSKKGGKTVVNVIAGGGHPSPMPMGGPAMAGPPPGPMPMPPPGGPPMPPRPMPGPMPGGPPGMPPGMPPRRAGGRAYKDGGRVADAPAWKEGRSAGTQVTHSPGKNDQAGLNRDKPITYAKGGKVESPEGVAAATKLPGGSGGGEARLAKEKRAASGYKRV